MKKKVKVLNDTPDGTSFLLDFHPSTPEEVTDPFKKFLKAVGVNIGKGRGGLHFHSEWTSPYSETFVVDLPFEVGEALVDLYKDLRKSFGVSISRAKQEGKKEGSNLLFQLHKGEITIKDFDKELKKGK